MNMRLLGAPTLKDVVPDMVDASCLHQHIVAVPDDRLFHLNCGFVPLTSPMGNAMLMCFADESLAYAQLREGKDTKSRM